MLQNLERIAFFFLVEGACFATLKMVLHYYLANI